MNRIPPILYLPVLLNLLLLFPAMGWAQTKAAVVRTRSFPEQLEPSGQFQIMDDSMVLLPANGGVFNLTQSKWHIVPDTEKVILSYTQKSSKNPGYLTAFVRSTHTTAIYKRTLAHGYEQFQKLQEIPPGGSYQVDSYQQSLFVYGADNQGFHFYEYRKDSLAQILQTRQYLPGASLLYNQNTVLFSVENLLFSSARFGALRKLLEFEEPIESFAVTDNSGIILSTKRGLFLQYADKDPLVLLAGSFGEIRYSNGLLYCINWADRVFRVVLLTG